MPGDSQDVSMINFTWKFTSLENDIMEIKLDFENPLYISSGYVIIIFNLYSPRIDFILNLLKTYFFKIRTLKV